MPREDVLLVWEELERGRDTLAEMQLIQLEKQTVGRSERHPLPQPCKEEYMSSIQWIEVRLALVIVTIHTCRYLICSRNYLHDIFSKTML